MQGLGFGCSSIDNIESKTDTILTKDIDVQKNTSKNLTGFQNLSALGCEISYLKKDSIRQIRNCTARFQVV